MICAVWQVLGERRGWKSATSQIEKEAIGLGRLVFCTIGQSSVALIATVELSYWIVFFSTLQEHSQAIL